MEFKAIIEWLENKELKWYQIAEISEKPAVKNQGY